jgi:FlaA1/EpsC-like NDP-sugar epimerase
MMQPSLMQPSLMQRLGVRRRRCLLAGADSLAWVVGLTAGSILRYDLMLHIRHPAGLVATSVMAVSGQLFVGTANGLYRGRWRVASFEGIGALASTCLLIGCSLLALNLFDGHLVPESVPIVGGVAALTLMLSGRYIARLMVERRSRPGGEGCSRLLVFGAGKAAEEVIATMLRSPDSPYLPVALLDDNVEKRHLSIMGVPVTGNRYDMARAKERFDADTLLVAIRSGSGPLHRELARLATETGLTVKVLPSLREVIEGTRRPYDIRRATIEDLLGRREIRTDLSAAAGYLTGRRVLVTGAGGSIGSELCRQIHRFEPAELIMLDRDETALHGLQLSIEGHGLLDSPNLVLLDIRDRVGLEALFANRRPEVVFHSAALKHLPMLERHPGEAVKSNIWGTLNVLEAAAQHGVDRFVNISTDKAVDPACVLGYSKRITERLTAAVGASSGEEGTYISVRFGNVLGSRGSVLHTFKAQILANGPVTVTHPEVRRYFMTVEEAIQLVIHAGAVGSSGEALVLDMGEPVRILEVAQRMIAEAGERIAVVYTGLRQGEKLNEVLFDEDELGRRLHHPLISHVVVPPLHPGRVPFIDPFAAPDVLIRELRDLCRSSGLRAEDEAGQLENARRAVELSFADVLAGRLGNLSDTNGRGPLVQHNGPDRCGVHRRLADRSTTDTCVACSETTSLSYGGMPVPHSTDLAST